MSEMHEPVVTPVLRREALLPNERSRGLGTVAVVCTMAGVASGLALATTLMAMQVADSMSTRGCPYRVQEVTPVDIRSDHGFLGIQYYFQHGAAEVDKVLPGTPADAIHLRHGDHIVRINGMRMTSIGDLQERIFNSSPGSMPTLTVERNGSELILRPTLIAWPSSLTY